MFKEKIEILYENTYSLKDIKSNLKGYLDGTVNEDCKFTFYIVNF